MRIRHLWGLQKPLKHGGLITVIPSSPNEGAIVMQ